MSIEGEKEYKSKTVVNYIFQKSKKPCDKLIVIFSAFSPKGTLPSYQYIRTLQSLDINKLFILDDKGERGCYYLGENKNFEVEYSVSSLIKFVINQCNIQCNNVICCGTSKGGYTSLYYGIKYGFGYIIAGAPQTKLGTYLNSSKELSTLKYIAGETSKESISYLDKLLYDIVSNSEKVPKIYIHVGIGDHHYKDHVIPLQQHLQHKGFDCNIDLGNYSDHGNVSYYQTFLIDKLIEIIPNLKNSFRIMDVNVSQNGSTFNIITKTNKQSQYAWYVYKNGDIFHKEWYTQKQNFTMNVKDNGEYCFIAFAKDYNGDVINYKTKKFAVEL